MPVQEIIEFVLLGVFVGTYGTLVGAGGGFIIVPILLIFFATQFTTTKPPAPPSSSSSATGSPPRSPSCARRRSITRPASRFAAATVPSAFIGGQVASYFGDTIFQSWSSACC
jgi:uncharacterized membrane protein YfcA